MSDQLAIALAYHCDGKWAAENFNETPDGTEPEENRDYWRDLAKVARNQVIQELIEKALGSEADGYKAYDGYVAEWLRSQTEEVSDE